MKGKKLPVEKPKINFEAILKLIKVILFISMLILIYMVSPRITNAIQNGAKYLYELEGTYITRVVELILSISFTIAVAKIIFGKEKK